MGLKFGKLPPKPHLKTLALSKYLTAEALPPPEEKRAWEYAVPDTTWAGSMLGNDAVGDCVIAAVLHFIMAARASAGKPIPAFTTQNALDLYSAVTGYDPSDPSTDQGTAWTDMLAYWQTTGVSVPGEDEPDKILAWAAFDFTDPTKLNQAIDIFGGTLIGTAITQSMEDQFNAGEPWNPPFTGGVLGGHGVPFLGYGSEGRTLITWAKRQATDLTFPSNMDEAYVVVTNDFLTSAGETPIIGLNLDALTSDLAAIKS
jgi:hypothetical protein